jgi:hypothetical protein
LEKILRSASRWPALTLLIAAALLGFAGCKGQSADATDRAKLFVRTLITRPDDAASLNALSDNNAEAIQNNLFTNVSTKVALDYLRARHRQGVPINMTAQYQAGADPRHAAVTIHIVPDETSGDALVLRIILKKTAADWIVTAAESVAAAPTN